MMSSLKKEHIDEFWHFAANLNFEDTEVTQLHRAAIDKGNSNGVERLGDDFCNLSLMKLDIRLDR